jgi:hypothetical protein
VFVVGNSLRLRRFTSHADQPAGGPPSTPKGSPS